MDEQFFVWVQVERQGPANDEHEEHDDVGLPDKLATFSTFGEAAAFIRTLPGWEMYGDTSDYRV